MVVLCLSVVLVPIPIRWESEWRNLRRCRRAIPSNGSRVLFPSASRTTTDCRNGTVKNCVGLKKIQKEVRIDKNKCKILNNILHCLSKTPPRGTVEHDLTMSADSISSHDKRQEPLCPSWLPSRARGRQDCSMKAHTWKLKRKNHRFCTTTWRKRLNWLTGTHIYPKCNLRDRCSFSLREESHLGAQPLNYLNITHSRPTMCGRSQR